MIRPLALAALSAVCAMAAPEFEATQKFLATYCKNCHSGKSAVGGFRLDKISDPESFATDSHSWTRAALRVRNGEMPPKGLPAPELKAREEFASSVHQTLRTIACASGITAGPSPLRRLNRDEYTATVQDLLDIHLDIGHALPIDGAGGEGFDNAAETLFLSPLHSEKYMETAKLAMDFAAKEHKSRTRILIAKPGPGVTPDQAARQILAAFLPRAFRRPVAEADLLLPRPVPRRPQVGARLRTGHFLCPPRCAGLAAVSVPNGTGGDGGWIRPRCSPFLLPMGQPARRTVDRSRGLRKAARPGSFAADHPANAEE